MSPASRLAMRAAFESAVLALGAGFQGPNAPLVGLVGKRGIYTAGLKAVVIALVRCLYLVALAFAVGLRPRLGLTKYATHGSLIHFENLAVVKCVNRTKARVVEKR